MSKFNGIGWTKKGHSEKCTSNSEHVKNYAKRFLRGHWSFQGPIDEEKWYGTHTYKPDGKSDSISTEMVGHFTETGHPVFKGISALSRGILKWKGGRCTIHFNADSSNTELLFRTIHSANQLSIYGAVSRWCEEFAQWTPNQKESFVEILVAKEKEQLLKNVKPQELNSLVHTPRSENRASGNRLRECLQRFETLEKEIQFTRVCEDTTFTRRISLEMSYKTIPDVDDGFGDRTSACREYTLPREDPKFQDLRNNSTTNYNWTSSSSSYYTVSWHQRIWNSDSFHSNKRFENVGDAKLSQKSLGGRVTSQWFRPHSRKFWIAGAYRIGKIYFNEKRTYFTRNAGIMEQRENSCEAVANSVNNLKKLFPLKKGSGMIFLPVIISKGFQRKYFWSRSLEIGYEIGTPLWSRRKGNRRSRSSDLVDKGKSTFILRFRTTIESSNRVDESKNTRLHRFRLMRGEDAKGFRSEPKMAWSTWRISTVQLLQRIGWNWWRTDWVRVEYFPRTCFIWRSSENF